MPPDRRSHTLDGHGPKCDRLHRWGAKRGIRLCRECGKEVQKPRKSWCSKECVDQYLARTKPIRAQVFARDKGVCAICGDDCSPPPDHPQLKFGYFGEWDADHIVPLCEGGAHSLQNLRTLCRPCHKEETKALAKRRSRKNQG